MTAIFEEEEKLNSLALEILSLAQSTLMLHLRFMAKAISLPKLKADYALGGMASDGRTISYSPKEVIKAFGKEKSLPARQYLHLLLHCIFGHTRPPVSVQNPALWSLSCDIAAENIINELSIHGTEYSGASEEEKEVRRLSEKVRYMTADCLYKHFSDSATSEYEVMRLSSLFSIDSHRPWFSRENAPYDREKSGGGGDDDEDPSEKWDEIARRLKMDLETFSKNRGSASGALTQNLRAVIREKYDYESFLRRFAAPRESVKINDDEFDYIFYTYGLKLYEKMPLVEPLEYKEDKKIREFVIAIDTSGSTSGELVSRFVNKTYNILQESGSFSDKFNLHIIQCDCAIQESVKIRTKDEFDAYISHMTIKGGGGTDFRPVFRYVEEKLREKEFVNLKGLIYFTDGFGAFPPRQPPYKTAFVFVSDAYDMPPVPVWAMRLVLRPEEIES